MIGRNTLFSRGNTNNNNAVHLLIVVGVYFERKMLAKHKKVYSYGKDVIFAALLPSNFFGDFCKKSHFRENREVAFFVHMPYF